MPWLFYLGLFAYLRISNLVPPSEESFDLDKHLVLGDVKCEPDGLALHLKWAKNLRRSDQYHIVRVSKMEEHPFMCPHYQCMQHI